MKRLLLVACLLAGIATAQPATMVSRPCRMDGADCFATAYSNLTGISASKLLGRGSSGAGAAQEITPGTGLTISGTTLTPDVSGSGAAGRLALWSSASGLTSDAGLTYSGTGTGTVLRIGSAGTGLSEISAGVIGVGTGAAGSVAGELRATTLTSLGTMSATHNNVTVNNTVFAAGTASVPHLVVGNGPLSGFGGYARVALYGTPLHMFDEDASILMGNAADAILSRRAAATLQLGAADSGTPVAQTLTVQGATGTNVAGQDFTIQGSRGTGSGASGKLVFQVATPLGTGSTQQTPATVLTLQDTGTGGVASPAVISAGPITSPQYRLSALNTAPSSATDTGTLGEIRIDSGYIYVCTATNTWVRAALATWP